LEITGKHNNHGMISCSDRPCIPLLDIPKRVILAREKIQAWKKQNKIVPVLIGYWVGLIKGLQVESC